MTTRDEIEAAITRFEEAIRRQHREGREILERKYGQMLRDDIQAAHEALAALLSPARPDGDVSISDAMVEAGARALHNLKTAWGVRPWEETSEFYRTEYRCMARAALDAAHDRPGGEEA